jgi:hypothetical protein
VLEVDEFLGLLDLIHGGGSALDPLVVARLLGRQFRMFTLRRRVNSYAFPIASRREPANRVVCARRAPTRRSRALEMTSPSARYSTGSIVRARRVDHDHQHCIADVRHVTLIGSGLPAMAPHSHDGFLIEGQELAYQFEVLLPVEVRVAPLTRVHPRRQQLHDFTNIN